MLRPEAPISNRFRRNHGRGNESSNTRPWRKISYSNRGRGTKNRAFARYGRGGGLSNVLSDSLLGAMSGQTSVLRPQFYAAPVNGLQITSFRIENPPHCPGWSLYFFNEPYNEDSIISQRIKVIQKHIINNKEEYNIQKILRERFFQLSCQIVSNDQNLKDIWPNLRHELYENPATTLATFGVAMVAVVTDAYCDKSTSINSSNKEEYVRRKPQVPKIHIRPFDFQAPSLISSITSERFDHLFCVRGTVLALGSVELTCEWAAYRCNRCSLQQAVHQTGFYASKPANCNGTECHSKKFSELRSSSYTSVKPIQTLRLLENHIQAVDVDNEHQDFIDVELQDDLVDSLCIGADVIITGILKLRQQTDAIPSKYFLQALSVQNAKKYMHNEFSEKDLEAMKMILEEQSPLKLLIHSLAPEVHGHEMAKAGIVLSLFGGGGSQVHNENEINVLLIGDPGVGKSCIAKMASKVSEKGAFINGKRDCGSGLGGYLKSTSLDRKNFSFCAGPLLTSNNGHCSIDDVDKLASHQEILLQMMQTSNFSFSSCDLLACSSNFSSVITTANSVRGHYDRSKLLNENIRLNSSLLSQFHLVFVLLDAPDNELDSSLADHIKALHSGMKKSSTIAKNYALKPKTNNSMVMEAQIENSNDFLEHLKIYEDEMDLFPPILMKKYIAYSRRKVRPLLGEKAVEALKVFYFNLRKEKAGDENSTPISTGQLEGLIRLSQARARINFCEEVTEKHVQDVEFLVRHSMAYISGDFIDVAGPANIATAGQGSQVKKFIRMLQMRSIALGRKVFEFEEIKDMATHAGITSGITNLVEVVNLQGYLLKKGPNLYEVIAL